MLKLPKPYLSYSQMRLWLEDKAKYRVKYYDAQEDRSSPELDFGKKVAEGLEDGSIVIPGLPLYPVPEWAFKGDVNGVPFAAYVDQYWPEKRKFRETKTGKHPWTQARVDGHMQLDIYSTCIEESEGSVDEECHLDWLVTRNAQATVEFDGHVLAGFSHRIEMTGEVVSFARVITKNERDRIRFLVRSVAEEITSDYIRYLSLRQ